MQEILKNSGCDIPDWAYRAIYAKLDNPETLRKEDITMITNYEPYLENMQLLVYASPSKYDGAFIIFEQENGQCREVYSQKTNLIGPVQTNYSDIFLTVLEEGSTGFATWKYYVIKHTPAGYRQAWEGLSSQYDLNRLIGVDVSASLTISHFGELLHSVLERRFRGNSPTLSTQVRKYVNVYRYNETAMRYQFVRRY